MTGRALPTRLARLEHALEPPGRIRTFRLPCDMSDAAADAWLAQHHPDVASADTVIMLRWVLPGERPARLVGEVTP